MNGRCEDCRRPLEAEQLDGEKYLRCTACGFIWEVPAMASEDEWRQARAASDE